MIEERAETLGFPALKRAAAAMSDAYREGNAAAFSRLPAGERVAAYLVTRMPATYAAAFKVLDEVRSRLSERRVASVLDLGAGTGAASLAARQLFPGASITMLERDRALADAARLWLPDAQIAIDDLERVNAPVPHDLVIAAYSLGEIDEKLAARFWEAARVALVLIEPGTPRGHALLIRIRRRLLSAGGHMLAPCPAAGECPLPGSDWCHFAARVERSSLHRRIKGAELGYEDEKFSYLAVAREPASTAAARILRRPKQEPGRITLQTCTPGGLVTLEVGKKDNFRAARRAEWGDEWRDA